MSPVQRLRRIARPIPHAILFVILLWLSSPMTHARSTAPDIAPAPFAGPDVWFDQPTGAGGELWSYGASYKARFDAAGATFVPFLGSKAPRSYPLTFRLESVDVDGVPIAFVQDVMPTRVDNDVLFDRGSVTELYAMRSGSMEQMFVFDDLPFAGDLTIRIRVAGAFESSNGEVGLAFTNERGGVTYSAAIAVGSLGGRRAATTRTVADLIEIKVPRQALESLAFPLVVDPVISSFSVEDSSADDAKPDVAYCTGSGNWFLVWERAFSASDHDILSCLVNPSGAVVSGSEILIDATTEDWRSPKVAYNRASELMLVVAEVGSAPSRAIYGRRRGASFVGTAYRISPATFEDCVTPDVGGDPTPGGFTNFCVVWEKTGFSGGDIYSQRVRPDGALVGPPAFHTPAGGQNSEPSISKSIGIWPAQGWTIVWRRGTGPREGGATDFDVRAAHVYPGGLQSPSFTVHSSDSEITGPGVSTALAALDGELRYVIVWQEENGSAQRLMGVAMRGTTQVAPTSGAVDLSQLLGAQPDAVHLRPSVDSDGSSFVLGFSEVTSTFPLIDHDVFAASLSLAGSELIVTEGPVALAASSGVDGAIEIAADRSSNGLPQGFFAAWTDGQFDFSGDVAGAIYRTPGVGDSYCIGGLNSVNSRAHISGSGGISLGLGSEWLTLDVTGCPPNKPGLFFLGTQQLHLPFGEGFRCVGGQVQRMYPPAVTDSTGHVERLVNPFAPYYASIFPGAPGINYQYWYRDPSGGPAGFNLSNGLHVEHTP